MRIDDLTACRALFAGWVFLYHARLALGHGSFGCADTLVARGYLGVDGFFILSGLILAHAHPDLRLAAGDAGRFWARRLLRLYPLHAAMIALMMLALVTGSVAGALPRDPGRFGGGELLLHALLLHGWGLSDRWAWNYPSWSISTEWAGYLAFPLLWFALRRIPAAACLAVLAAMLGLLAATDGASGFGGLNLTYHGALLRFFPEFIAGMATARLAASVARPWRGGVIAGLGVAATIIASLFLRDWLAVGGLWMLLAGLLIAARQGRAAILARLPGLLWLGAISYAFYMSFALVETAQALAWRRLDVAPADRPLLYVGLSTVLTLGLATAGWWCVERPALRLGRHLAARAPAV